MNYITIDEMKTIWAPELDYSNVPDPSLSGMISAASLWVDSITNADKGWKQETITDEDISSITTCHTNADGDLVIPLIKRPLLSLADMTSIKIKKGAYITDLTLTSGGSSVLSSPSPGWSITYPNTWLVATGTLLSNQRLYNLRSFGYTILLSYKAGYATLPDDIKYATALRVQSIMAKKYNPMGADSFRQGSMSASFQRSALGEDPLTVEAKVALRNYIRVV